jgi:hypothetical protein
MEEKISVKKKFFRWLLVKLEKLKAQAEIGRTIREELKKNKLK